MGFGSPVSSLGSICVRSPSSPSSSHASASSSARLPNALPRPEASPKSLANPIPPDRSCEETGRGVVADWIDWIEDFRLWGDLFKPWPLLCGLEGVIDRSRPEDGRRRGVRGEDGIFHKGGYAWANFDKHESEEVTVRRGLCL